ncbi:MAG: malate synthase, partial [Paenibacillaceae bacterium]|nr:malate synthase [Paenibacillaceae bacterium]
MTHYVKAGNLQVAEELYQFINSEALPGTGLSSEQFWSGLDSLIHDLSLKNKALLAKRDDIQNAIHEWHKQNKHQFSFEEYKTFLQ